MGSFFDCRVDPDFALMEISEEITKKNEKKNPLNKSENINIENRKIKLKKNKKLNNKGNVINTEDEDIIINTDEEKSINGKENTIKNNKNIKGKNKKINNTIFINNSNVTISQGKEKKINEEINEIKQDFKCFNTNEDNIELDEFLNNVFTTNSNNNKANSLCYTNNKNVFTESDIDYNYNKEYFDQLYSEQSQIKLGINTLNENDEKIIKKLNKLKEKINNKNKPKEKHKNYHKFKFEFNPIKAQRTISMTNKQIKKNIPSYRKNSKVFNSISFGKNNFRRKYKVYTFNNTENSFNKSLYNSLMFESVKGNNIYNSANSNNFSNNIIEGTPSIYSLQKSYFNNSSINQNSSNGFNKKNKIQKGKKLYNVVSKKIKNKSTSKNNKKEKTKIIENIDKIEIIDIKKEIEQENNYNNFLYHEYRDIIEIILPNNFFKESVVNNKIYGISDSNKKKVVLNYNKLNNYNISVILYDGILYKVNDKKNNGFKLSLRYFQITKNCFRYYNTFEKREEKPLVQFDIRHIKDLQIIENDFLNEYKIDNKDIEMVFCVYLYQNDDFFVFAVNNENFGKNVFDILNLLKNYFEDKK
jgi:hypothetical protein